MKVILKYIMTLVLAGSLSASGLAIDKNDPPVKKGDSTIQIYPNPVKDFFYVSSIDNVKIKRIIVFNIVGHKILDYSPKTSYDYKERVDVSRLTSGKYFIKVLLENNTQEMKHLIKL